MHELTDSGIGLRVQTDQGVINGTTTAAGKLWHIRGAHPSRPCVSPARAGVGGPEIEDDAREAWLAIAGKGNRDTSVEARAHLP